MHTAPVRHIAHLDMDAFYASVELLRYPALRGQPVVIGGGADHTPLAGADGEHRFFRLRDYVGRGVVTTSTYEARALGVFSGMGTMKAARLAPDAILLPTDFVSYRRYSSLFKAAVARFASQIEDRGIDEIYIDLSAETGDVRAVAQRIKDAVYAATGLSCSIGVAPNKMLAKICSDLEKPDGLTILTGADIPARIWPLSVSKINGIGPKAAEKLRALGLHTIEELAAADPGLLQATFGATYGCWLLRVAHGVDHRPVTTHAEPKSLSRESTFASDLHPTLDRLRLTEIFNELCERVAKDLQKKVCIGRTVGVKVRFADFTTLTRDVTLPDATDNPVLIRRAARDCLRRIPMHQRLRLLGIRVSTLSKKNPDGDCTGVAQGDLFRAS